MENPSGQESKEGVAKKKSARRAASTKTKRGRSSATGTSSPSQLMTRGRNLATKAQRWAGDATRFTAPIVDIGSNALVIGVLGMGIGVAIGAMLPRLSLPAVSLSSLTPSGKVKRPKKSARKRS
jgi:hypothetical protein